MTQIAGERRMLIDGDLVEAEGGRSYANVNPATEGELGAELLKKAFEGIHCGDPTEPINIMGPLINARQRDRVLADIEKGKTDRALKVAPRIRTRTVAVNGGIWFGPDSPFGGYKQSGLGREHGLEGFEAYLETKTLGLPTVKSAS